MSAPANRMGVCEWSLPVQGVAAIRLAAEIGFDGIQLGDAGGGPAGHPLATDRALKEAYRVAAREGDIRLQALHLHTLVREGGMTHPRDSAEGRRALVSIEAGIVACAALGAPVLMLTAGFACQIENEEDFQRFGDMLCCACDMAEREGVRIAFESLLSVVDIRRMRTLTGGRARICYDTYNMLRFGKGNPLDDLAALRREDIDHFHLKDAPADNVGCTFLGEGRGEYEAVVDAVRALGYSGWYVSENYYNQPPLSERGTALQTAARDLATMRRSFP